MIQRLLLDHPAHRRRKLFRSTCAPVADDGRAARRSQAGACVVHAVVPGAVHDDRQLGDPPAPRRNLPAPLRPADAVTARLWAPASTRRGSTASPTFLDRALHRPRQARRRADRGHTATARPAYAATLGLADRERGVPLADNTIFRIYSMTKPLTSLAFMMLVEEGKVALDDPVHRYIPAWRTSASLPPAPGRRGS